MRKFQNLSPKGGFLFFAWVKEVVVTVDVNIRKLGIKKFFKEKGVL